MRGFRVWWCEGGVRPTWVLLTQDSAAAGAYLHSDKQGALVARELGDGGSDIGKVATASGAK